MSDMNNAVAIGAHIATMAAEQINVEDSKTELSNAYAEYLEDNQALRTDWEGDTAQIFTTYSNCMNKMLKAAIGTTDVFGHDIITFYKETLQLDMQAEINAGGNN